MKETVNNFIADKFGTSEVCPVGFDPLAQPKAFAQDLGNFVYQLHQLEATGAENPALMLPVIEAEFLTLLDQMKRIAPVEGLRLYWDKASKKSMDQACGCFTWRVELGHCVEESR